MGYLIRPPSVIGLIQPTQLCGTGGRLVDISKVELELKLDQSDINLGFDTQADKLFLVTPLIGNL